MNYLQNPVLPVACVGEEIGFALANQMLNEFHLNQSAKDLQGFLVGKDILEAILAQPNCQGINFYKAVNENGDHTFVYLGADDSGQNIVSYKSVGSSGELINASAIVADRLFPRTEKPANLEFPSEFEWTID